MHLNHSACSGPISKGVSSAIAQGILPPAILKSGEGPGDEVVEVTVLYVQVLKFTLRAQGGGEKAEL